MEKTLQRRAAAISKEAAFILLTVASALVLPQVCHVAGTMLGMDGALGQMLLPMYLPVMLLGFSRGKVSGAVAGLVTPLVSFALTTMPTSAMLPFITLELVATGVLAGAFAGVKLPSVCRVLLVQMIAKAVRVFAMAVSLYAATGAVTASVLFAGVLVSLPGILLQLVVVCAFLAKRGQRDA